MIIRPADEAHDLARAMIALRTTLAAAAATNPALSPKELTTATMTVTAPYAREIRLLVATVAATHHVLTIGTPLAPGGKYTKGAVVTLYGYRSMVEEAQDHSERVVTHARQVAAASTPALGEDTATHRISVLAGYRLGLSTPGLDAEAVRALVGTREAHGVRVATSGSGSWAGYCAAHMSALAA